MNKIIILLLIIIHCSKVYCQSSESNSTIQKAIEAGVTSLDQYWVPSDLTKLANYIEAIEFTNYPVLKNKASSPIFNKLIFSCSMPSLFNEEHPLNSRIQEALELQASISRISKSYLTAHLEKPVFEKEIVYLQGIVLMAASQTIYVMKEFMETLDPNDQDYENRMLGLQKAKNGIIMQLNGSIVTLQGKEQYSDEERLIFAEYLTTYGVDLATFIDQIDKFKFYLELQMLISQEVNSDISNQLEQLSKLIK